MAENDTCTPMNDIKEGDHSNDAHFRFCMSEDGMKLGVNRYFPPKGHGAKPSVELLKQQVAAAGVRLSVDEEAAEKILSHLAEAREITGITLVRGVEVQNPEDARFETIGNLDYPVFPGYKFAVKYPPKKARQGETIDGKITKPSSTDPPEDIKIQAGENCDFDATEGTFTSQVYGMARVDEKEGLVWVDPLLRIDSDNITVTSTIFHQDCFGRPLSVQALEKELLDLGVAIEIDPDAIDKFIRKASVSQQPVPNAVLVRGRHPVNGKDGWLEYLVSTRDATGTEDESGRVDFKDRGAYPSVAPGQTIARLHPPTKGEGGIDIYAKTLPANEGVELHVHPGENVEICEDGATFTANATGIMVLDRNVLSVSECLVLPENVDMNTGNVKVDTGSVKIMGNVQAGFHVAAPKNIIVQGSIESAEVEAGENIEVGGGILMPDGGMVTAQGNITVSYMNNARVHAHGSILFKNEISNSTIQADGYIRAEKGKGIIQGGSAICSRGMEVNELGSELGVQTIVGINLSTSDDREAMAERANLAKEIKRIDKALGNGNPKDILRRVPPEKRPSIVKVLKHRMELAKRYKEVADELAEKAEIRRNELRGVTIKVLRTIHGGTVIKMGGHTARVKRTMDRSLIYWSEEEQKIAFGTL
ncbi:FapA family protein [Salidesulfovibrio onnuriiensis]|uniref:FapA family protein n=1 Tax=Salidesulfovibrio onnuriiensis TaxID=2583823 RepID=UPI0016502E2E|nr:FapA family protein [Salidesulfovibrio onnuriiensis]